VQLAKALNCVTLHDDACDSCASCANIDKGAHPDVHCVDKGDEQIAIDDIRALQRQMSLRPYEGRKKVFIICNAHKLNPDSASALLKTLEEPSKNSVIILITHKPVFLLKTIISRCKSIKFSALAPVTLKLILSGEYGIALPQAHFLAHYCEGSLGRALGLREDDIVRKKNAIIDEFCAQSNSRAQDSGVAKDPRFQFSVLASWLRDLYLVKAGVEETELIHADRYDELMRNQERFSFAELDEAIQQVASSIKYLDNHINVNLLRANVKWQFNR
jgi:DNA polymerase-3 subunit delta'